MPDGDGQPEGGDGARVLAAVPLVDVPHPEVVAAHQAVPRVRGHHHGPRRQHLGQGE